jgi:hypothetical protein
VRVTERGRKVQTLIRGEVMQIEREWAVHLGTGRFEALRATLRDLATWLGRL